MYQALDGCLIEVTTMRELLFKGQPNCGHLIEWLSAILFYNRFGTLITGCLIEGSHSVEVNSTVFNDGN